MHNVTLLVNNKQYEFWESVEINSSIEAAARTFSLQVFEAIPKQSDAPDIKAGDSCKVLIDGNVLITGYIDDVHISYSASQHVVSVTGRCKTADIVDCSPNLSFNEWNDRSLEQIAHDVCTPYGIKVVAKSDTGAKFKLFRLEQGERCIETIERLCRHRGLLRTSNENGDLVLTKGSTETVKTALKSGENVKSARASSSHVERFSKYVVKGQNTGSDTAFATDVSEAEGIAKDPNIRNRTTVIVAEDIGDNLSLADRAAWEARMRRTRSVKFNVNVVGWMHADGLWQSNRLVKYIDTVLGVNETLLISAVQYKLNESDGFLTSLTLVPKDAFDVLSIAEEQDAGGLF